MRISKEEFLLGASKAKLHPKKAETLWIILEKQTEKAAKANRYLHILYFVAAFIVIGAMGYFLFAGVTQFETQDLFIVLLVYIAIFIFVGNVLWRK